MGAAIVRRSWEARVRAGVIGPTPGGQKSSARTRLILPGAKYKTFPEFGVASCVRFGAHNGLKADIATL